MGFSSGWSCELEGGTDCIVACATPPGRSALAVIRVSGPDLRSRAARVVPGLSFEQSWQAQLVAVESGGKELGEKAIVIVYRSPRSYTGEDLIEMMVHGSTIVVSEMIGLWQDAGCRLAGPGEFTRRAVANGKMDLLQAEGVADLIEAETRWQLRNARLQLGGGLSREVERVRAVVVELLAAAEAAVDLVGSDVEVEAATLRSLRDRAASTARALLRGAEAGMRVREGFRVVIAGRTNAGKSTLFNAMVGRDRAIVAAEPGTTRDVVEVDLEIGGAPVCLVDTAGIGGGGGAVGEESELRARRATAEADIVIGAWAADGERPMIELGGEQGFVGVRTKADLMSSQEREGVAGAASEWILVSALEGFGLEEVSDRLAGILGEDLEALESTVGIATRHRVALEECVGILGGLEICQPELCAEGVRQALRALAAMTGEVDTEDVLERVFSRFCVGK